MPTGGKIITGVLVPPEPAPCRRNLFVCPLLHCSIRGNSLFSRGLQRRQPGRPPSYTNENRRRRKRQREGCLGLLYPSSPVRARRSALSRRKGMPAHEARAPLGGKCFSARSAPRRERPTTDPCCCAVASMRASEGTARSVPPLRRPLARSPTVWTSYPPPSESRVTDRDRRRQQHIGGGDRAAQCTRGGGAGSAKGGQDQARYPGRPGACRSRRY